MGFIDSHTHLQFPDYDADRGEVIRRSQETGIEGFITVGSDLENSKSAIKIAEQYPNIWASVGIHPHDAKTIDAVTLQNAESLLAHPKVVALGEIGLDFFRDLSPRENQEEIFRQFLNIHRKTKKPLILHCRDAYDRMIEILTQMIPPPYEGVVHCFSSDEAVLKRLVDLGFLISFTGALTYKKNDALRKACQACPVDRLLIETDAPYLAPQSMRGKRNEPAFMLETAQVASEIRRIPLETLGELTSRNARSIFKI